MPYDPQTKDTKELLDKIAEGMLTSPQWQALNELYVREIKQGDSDDFVQNNKNITRGGIRPKHAPIVP
jgi:hypothetical protein